jgi:hypothetical protein
MSELGINEELDERTQGTSQAESELVIKSELASSIATKSITSMPLPIDLNEGS